MKLGSLLCVIATLSVLLAAPSSHAMLQVDFNNSNSSATNTPADYLGVRVGDVNTPGGIPIGQIGGSSVNLRVAADGTEIKSAENGTGNSLAPILISRDYIYSDADVNGANKTDSTYLDVIFSGIPAGTYTFTGIFHDQSSSQLALSLSTDGGTPAHVTTFEMNGVGAGLAATGTFDFTAVDGKEVQLRIVSNQGNHVINGFSLAAVPEAGAFLVWSMLSGVALVRHRGKRRA